MQIRDFEPLTTDFFLYQLKIAPVYVITNILSAIAFAYGSKFFGSLTLSVLASNLIKIVSLGLIAFLILHEIPSYKTIIGLGFILIGIIIAK